MKKLIILLIFLILNLYIQLYFIININYIKRENGQIKYIGEKILELNNNYKYTEFEHLNIKGEVTTKTDYDIAIKLSEDSNKFLKNDYIKINNNNNLEVGDKVFIYLKNIKVINNKLKFNSLRIYKLVTDIKYTENRKSSFIVKNWHGGFLKIKGQKIKYQDNIYFISDQKLNDDKNIFYVDIEDGILLCEEYKDVFFPEVYNMINYQETDFNEMIKIYSKRQ